MKKVISFLKGIVSSQRPIETTINRNDIYESISSQEEEIEGSYPLEISPDEIDEVDLLHRWLCTVEHGKGFAGPEH